MHTYVGKEKQSGENLILKTKKSAMGVSECKWIFAATLIVPADKPLQININLPAVRMRGMQATLPSPLRGARSCNH